MDKDIKLEYSLVTQLFERIVALELRITDLENKLSYSKKKTFDYKHSDDDAFKCINGAKTNNIGEITIQSLIDLHKKGESK